MPSAHCEQGQAKPYALSCPQSDTGLALGLSTFLVVLATVLGPPCAEKLVQSSHNMKCPFFGTSALRSTARLFNCTNLGRREIGIS